MSPERSAKIAFGAFLMEHHIFARLRFSSFPSRLQSFVHSSNDHGSSTPPLTNPAHQSAVSVAASLLRTFTLPLAFTLKALGKLYTAFKLEASFILVAVIVRNVYHHIMATQDDYIKTALRLPRALHAELHTSAESKGRSLNAELIDRLQGGADQGANALIQVIARQNADLAERDLDLHKITLQATALAQTLQIISDLFAQSDMGKMDNAEGLLEEARKLCNLFPANYEQLKTIGAEKVRKYQDANDKLVSQIKASSEIPLTAADSKRAVKRVLRTLSPQKS